MKPPIKVKLSGAKDDLEAVIVTLEKDWECRATSDFLINTDNRGRGVHVFILLTPRWGS